MALEDKERYKREMAVYKLQLKRQREVRTDDVHVQNCIRRQAEEQIRLQAQHTQQIIHENMMARKKREAAKKEQRLQSQHVPAHEDRQALPLNESERRVSQTKQVLARNRVDEEYPLLSQHAAAHEQRFLEWQNRKRQQLAQKQQQTQQQPTQQYHSPQQQHIMPSTARFEVDRKTEKQVATPPVHRLLLTNQPQQAPKDTQFETDPEPTAIQPEPHQNQQNEETLEGPMPMPAEVQLDSQQAQEVIDLSEPATGVVQGESVQGQQDEVTVTPDSGADQSKPDQDNIGDIKANKLEDLKELAC